MVRDVLAIQASSVASEAALVRQGFKLVIIDIHWWKTVWKQQFYLETGSMPKGGITIC